MSKAKKSAHGKEHHQHEAGASSDSTSAPDGADESRPEKMKRKEYEREMRILQGELVAMQEWVKATGARVCVVFEGVDSAGKGGTIRRITERTSPRVFKHIALPAPDARVKSQMYIQRYMAHFPSAGEVVIFDRSWYNRAGVEPVMGYCTPGGDQAVPGHGADGREGDGRRRDHLDQVLPQRQPRRADPEAREPDRRPAEGLEALAHGPEVLQPSVRLPPGPRHDDRRDQLGVGALAHRGQRRQEARSAEHHHPPARSDPVRSPRGRWT